MLKQLLSTFVETDDPPQTKTTKPSAEPAKVSAPATTPSATTPSTSILTSSGQIDPDIAAILNDAIEKSNLEGFDYLEFKSAIDQLATTQLMDEQKYAAVFVTAKTMDPRVTKQKLVESVDHYVKVVDSKKVEFQQFLDQTYHTSIHSGEQKLQELNETIAKATQEIERLTKNIQEIRVQQEVVSADITKHKIAAQQKMAAFEATSGDILQRLNQDKQKLQTYLKG